MSFHRRPPPRGSRTGRPPLLARGRAGSDRTRRTARTHRSTESRQDHFPACAARTPGRPRPARGHSPSRRPSGPGRAPPWRENASESRCGHALRPCLGGAREVGRLAEPAHISRLVAHRVQNARAEQPVISRLGERECLDEVPLSERAGGHAVVAHPGREESRLGHRRVQRPPGGFAVPATQQAPRVGAEVLDERRAARALHRTGCRAGRTYRRSRGTFRCRAMPMRTPPARFRCRADGPDRPATAVRHRSTARDRPGPTAPSPSPRSACHSRASVLGGLAPACPGSSGQRQSTAAPGDCPPRAADCPGGPGARPSASRAAGACPGHRQMSWYVEEARGIRCASCTRSADPEGCRSGPISGPV